MKKQADSIKQSLIQQGFIVVKGFRNHGKQYEMPVIVPLNEGSWYQFVFIGDVGSKINEVRDVRLERETGSVPEKFGSDPEGNIISFPIYLNSANIT